MDGSAYIYRGFFANRTLQRSDGFPTGALVVVSRILLRILRQERPRWFCFVKDGRGKNFRHDIYPQYKANREAMPEELSCQLEPIERMVHALGIHYEETEGFEADDGIASLAARFSKEHPVVIVSGDKDLRQCLGPNVVMWDPGSKKEKLITAEVYKEENGFGPDLQADMQALTGDSVDNIPGVPGIGPKTVQQIFAICPGLEAIRDHFPLLPPKFQKKLQDHLEDMFLWRRLTMLSRDFCQNVSLDDLAVQPLNLGAAADLVREFELMAMRWEIDALAREEQRPRPRQDSAAKAEGAETAVAPEVKKRESAAPRPSETPVMEGTAESLSLLDVVPDVAAAELEVRSDPASLPSVSGCTVAVIWPDGPDGRPGVAVEKGGTAGVSAAGAEEFAWGGDDATLACWASGADRIVVADAKSLMEKAPHWQKEMSRRAGEGRGLFDLGLAAYLFDPEDGDYSWKRLAGLAQISDPGLGRGGLGVGALALGLAARDILRLERDGLAPLYTGLELPLMPVLADMEREGIAIDMPAFRAFLNEVEDELKELTEKVYAEAGGPFNIRSAQQLGELLFTKLGLPQSKKTRGGQFSTSQEALEKLAGRHPVVDAILRYRKLEKIRSTYLEPLPRLTDAGGRLHTTFNQEATATGRLSSSGPNLQNSPVRGPLGKRMRSCFVAREGSFLVSCDYSQIELRVLAHMSGDPALIASFRNGEDIHSRTAALVYGIEPDEVTPDQRRSAKTINFGLIYGMGAQKLGRELGISTKEAKDFIDRYFSKLSGLKAFYERVEKQAKQDGFVTTLGGRRRLLPGLNSSSGQIYALAKRQAFNTVIQGSAADIIKIAMLSVYRNEQLREWGAHMVLQIHDELVLEVPEAYADGTGKLVSELMEAVRPGGVEFSVPLVVDWSAARDWGAAH